MDTNLSSAAVHPWDEGAQEPSSLQLGVSFLIGFFWLGTTAPWVPLGLLINLLRLGSMTGANTWGGRLRFGKKALLASAVGAAVGMLLKTGLFFTRGGITLHLF